MYCRKIFFKKWMRISKNTPVCKDIQGFSQKTEWQCRHRLHGNVCSGLHMHKCSRSRSQLSVGVNCPTWQCIFWNFGILPGKYWLLHNVLEWALSGSGNPWTQNYMTRWRECFSNQGSRRPDLKGPSLGSKEFTRNTKDYNNKQAW